MKVLVSACLVGVCCRYDGKGKDIGLKDKYSQLSFIPICPEVMGGLPTPRSCAEISQERVVTIDGSDVTKEFAVGAQKALAVALKHNCTVAILKARSPSCGSDVVYDGTFSGKLVSGDGALAAVLKGQGIVVFSEENMDGFEGYLRKDG